jgi:hypothetical protein
MKKAFFFLAFTMCAAAVFGQAHDRIDFSYERHTNVYINEEGVFADTLLLKFDFPGMDYTLRKHPLDAQKTVGFRSLASLMPEERRQLVGLMYHTNESLTAIFDRKKNVTTIFVTRTNQGQEAFFKYLKQAFPGKFKYTITIDYNRGTIEYDFPQTSRGKDEQADTYAIAYTSDDKTKGSYAKQSGEIRIRNLVELDPALDPKIVAADVFNNNPFGMRKTVSVDDTLELVSYSYK